MPASPDDSASAPEHKVAAPGRPAGRDSELVRAKLLEAARHNYLGNEFRSVSVRQIAEAAGVNAAMVNYYFGSKQGLYLAMVDSVMSELEVELNKLAANKDLTVADFSSSYCRLLAANPWWPNFIVREVLFSSGEIREAMIQRFSSAFAPRLIALLQEDIANGEFRQDLNPVLTLMSLMGMTVFPFLARPILESVLNVKIDESMVETLAAHNTTLFLNGVTATD